MPKKGILIINDAVLIACAYFLSYFIRFDCRYPVQFIDLILKTLPIIILVKIVTFFFVGMYKPVWRYASISAVLLIIWATLLSSLVSAFGLYILNLRAPRSILILDLMISFLLVGSSRLLVRLFKDYVVMRSRPENHPKDQLQKRILIYGAGDAGELVLRELKSNQRTRHVEVVGFIDDYKGKGSRIHNVPILGNINDSDDIIDRHRVEELIVAISSLPGEKMRQLVERCGRLGVRFKAIPRIGDIVDGKITMNQLRDVEISDLLKRDPKNLDWDLIQKFIKDKRVCVSGSGGSIGSELCMQIAECAPAKLILIENSEFNLYSIQTKLADKWPKLRVVSFLASVADPAKIDSIISEHKPQIIFHAAAYKHVPICEDNICASVFNNVGGTVNIARAADRHGVSQFVFISTDKAVNPKSVMGQTKKLGELFVHNLDRKSKSSFMIVRFGNVLKSSGSVLTRFREQVLKGGPVTVTHPEATRYFMLIDEAVKLILQAGSIGKGGETFVLDMGSPVKVIDMARELITTMGYRPDKDIKIEYISLRPGEKIHEELFEDIHQMDSIHESIFMSKNDVVDWSELNTSIEELLFNASQHKTELVRKGLDQICQASSFSSKRTDDLPPTVARNASARS